MRTTLDIDDDVIAAAKEHAASEHHSLGSVVELARRGLLPARVDADGDLPVIRVRAGTAPITPEMVRRAIDEN